MKYLILTLLVLLPGVLFSQVQLNEDISLLIPGIDQINTYQFKDIDYDNYPEIILTDGYILQIYSITADSILFRDTLPTSSYAIKDINLIFDDINRDSITDIVFSRYLNETEIGSPINAYYDVFVYNGSSNFSRTDYLDFITKKDGNPLKVYLGEQCQSVLEAEDINNDGYNELFLSIEDVDQYFIPDSGSFTIRKGITRTYYSFPDSVITESDQKINQIKKLNHDEFGTNSYLVTQNNLTYQLNDSSKQIENNFPQIYYDYNLLDDTIFQYTQSELICSIGFGFRNIDYIVDFCIGNIDASDNNLEIVYNYSYLHQLECVFSVDTKTSEDDYTLTMYKNTNGNEFNKSYSVSNYYLTELIYHPLLPGYFLGFYNHDLNLYNGSDGSVAQFVDTVPIYPRKWVTLFDDDIPYLVATDSNLIKIYSLGIATDIDDFSLEILPSKFELNQNYPNPFNPTTEIRYTIPNNGELNISVYNILGEKVATFYSGQIEAGTHSYQWDGSYYSSGIYLIKAAYNNESKTVKAVLIK